MPHSSGGGSHSGGSHGGSHHSGGRSQTTYSRSHFPGSRRFVYYRHGTPHYFYTTKQEPGKFSKSRLFIGLFYIPFLIAIIFMCKEALPKKYSDHEIKIIDEAKVLGDTTELYDTLETFHDKSGITPAVITVNNEDWNRQYSDLESYAYDRYLMEFDDEMHWLIVYSQPVEPDPKFNDWLWEGMQGDDTDPILTESITSKFNAELHNALLNDKTKPSYAIAAAFNSINNKVKDGSKIRLSSFAMPLFMFAFIAFHAFFMLGLNELKYRNAVPAPDDNDIITCPKCGSTYMADKVRCPVCSGGIVGPMKPAQTQIKCRYCDGTYMSSLERCPHCGALKDQ